MSETHSVTADELRSFLERFEGLEAEKRDISEQQKELMAELKGRGYDAKRFKEGIRLRKMKPEARAEFEAVVDMYKAAAGLA